jgi:hypothetical protein
LVEFQPLDDGAQVFHHVLILSRVSEAPCEGVAPVREVGHKVDDDILGTSATFDDHAERLSGAAVSGLFQFKADVVAMLDVIGVGAWRVRHGHCVRRNYTNRESNPWRVSNQWRAN